MKIKIGLASYGPFSQFIEQIEQSLPQDVELLVFNDLFAELETTVRRIEANRSVDVFVSAGGNAEYLEKYLREIPLIKIELTGFDVLHALKEAKHFSNHVAIITKSPVKEFEALVGILDMQIEEIAYSKSEDIDAILQTLYARGIRDVVGTSYVLDRARVYGMRGFFIYSKESVDNAFSRAIILARNIRDTLGKAIKLNHILDHSAEGIILTDKDGIITDINTSAERILRRSRKTLVGKHCQEVLPSTELHRVIADKRPQYNRVQDLGNVKIVTNRCPIMYEGEVIGALATFFSVNTIKQAERSVRQTQFNPEYLAKSSFDSMIGTSRTYADMVNIAKRYAQFDSTVLICGQSGTGKGLIAQSIHNASHRKKERFVTVNCSAFSANLLERELFGVEKDATSGSKSSGTLGAMELAHRGTLFLDEVGDIPLKLQARLLQAIEDGETRRIGGDCSIRIDLRIIASTNKDLFSMVQEGTFREDLYYRLNVLRIDTPALKDRKEDIPLFIRQFIPSIRGDLTKSEMEQISYLHAFTEYSWPGNIRQLRNVLERFCILYQPGENMDELASHIMDADVHMIIPAETNSEAEMYKEALKKAGGNREKTAELLGISRTTLWRKLRELNISD